MFSSFLKPKEDGSDDESSGSGGEQQMGVASTPAYGVAFDYGAADDDATPTVSNLHQAYSGSPAHNSNVRPPSTAGLVYEECSSDSEVEMKVTDHTRELYRKLAQDQSGELRAALMGQSPFLQARAARSGVKPKFAFGDHTRPLGVDEQEMTPTVVPPAPESAAQVSPSVRETQEEAREEEVEAPEEREESAEAAEPLVQMEDIEPMSALEELTEDEDGDAEGHYGVLYSVWASLIMAWLYVQGLVLDLCGGVVGFCLAVYENLAGYLGGVRAERQDAREALDEAKEFEEGFVCRGGRMLNLDLYENFWDLLSTTPSIDQLGKSTYEEIVAFDAAHPTCSSARLVDKDRHILEATDMGLCNKCRMLLAKLSTVSYKSLDNVSIDDFFGGHPHFYKTNFWFMWQTTFAFQPWSSVFEMKRYMRRCIKFFNKFDTLGAVARTPLNQYESVIRPLQRHLEGENVDFQLGCLVKDVTLAPGEGITVTGLSIERRGTPETITLRPQDMCCITNGAMCDCAVLGDLTHAAPPAPENPKSFDLWRKLCTKREGVFGNPEPFAGKWEESYWHSFTVTMKGNRLLKEIEAFSGNVPGSGALCTLVDSRWRMSIVVPAQPHFRGQPKNQTVFWGYMLHTDITGDYVNKTVREATGADIFTELMSHLRMEGHEQDIVNVIPCSMPYIDAHFNNRAMADRPPVIPEGSTNLAMIGQYVEIEDEMSFTEEMSVRAARMAVYGLAGCKDKKVIPVSPYWRNPLLLATAIKKVY
ncbi:oleate hydratase [Kipferlia bialata]|uniref:Oleate hydratase n=1 Tax=Kipferlia bialata TaxID=797122 RepID=A0A9K3CUL8_9EUKA|nr:oleate hydratase [Kipferlia bialata]|eukprot:g4978.t1